MITVHHLNNSRSQRILWLLEELNVKYEIRHYQRDVITNRAPDELKVIHPLGKSPVIEDGNLIIAETGAIIEYLLNKYDKNQLLPNKKDEEYNDYLHFLHFAEGSAMLPLLLSLFNGFLGKAGAPLEPLISKEIRNILNYCEQQLTKYEYFVRNKITGADILMIFPLEAARSKGLLSDYEACNEYVEKIHNRVAYKAALKRGGTYSFGPINN
ncbi:MAG: glutathione S-transferase [Hellea sp.]